MSQKLHAEKTEYEGWEKTYWDALYRTLEHDTPHTTRCVEVDGYASVDQTTWVLRVNVRYQNGYMSSSNVDVDIPLPLLLELLELHGVELCRKGEES